MDAVCFRRTHLFLPFKCHWVHSILVTSRITLFYLFGFIEMCGRRVIFSYSVIVEQWVVLCKRLPFFLYLRFLYLFLRFMFTFTIF